MNLLLISPSYYPATYYGGPIYSTFQLSKSLRKNGLGVNVISTNANGSEKLKVKTGISQTLENDLPVKYYKSLDSRGTSPSMLWNLRSEIKKADVVYLVSIFSVPTPFTILICRLLKKPLIISPRGQLGTWCLEQGNPFKKLWLRLFVGSINQSSKQPFYWHLTSESEQQEIIAIYPSARTIIVPNGISSEFFLSGELKKSRSIYSKYTNTNVKDFKIIISHSRIHKKKGYDILIQAVKMLKTNNVILLIAGEDFGEKKNLEELIDHLEMRERVFLIGRIEGQEKIEFLRNADVFALVASKNTPWQDVEKYNCGKWVDNTPEKFAIALDEILAHVNEEMNFNASKFIKEFFDLEKLSKIFISKIEQILNAK